MKELKIKIKKLSENAEVPKYETMNASGLDLKANIKSPRKIMPLERVLIPSGISIEVPEGFEAQIRPRSGLSFKHGITLINCVGTIDADYRGEILIPVVNLSNEPYEIQPQERVCQMVISKVEHVQIELVEEISETTRGSGGFGSTGK